MTDFITRANLFEHLQKDFPIQYQQFSRWFSIYRKHSFWRAIVVEGSDFLYWPIDLQIGIFFRFFREEFRVDYPLYDTGVVSMVQYVRDVFASKFMDDQTALMSMSAEERAEYYRKHDISIDPPYTQEESPGDHYPDANRFYRPSDGV